jgi:hypothetical protein
MPARRQPPGAAAATLDGQRAYLAELTAVDGRNAGGMMPIYDSHPEIAVENSQHGDKACSGQTKSAAAASSGRTAA